MQQQAVECNFAENDSWIILSAIEQSIKRKIEAVGTPLKDWDIRINYGIKTGFNETFVITTDKRNEILANCQTEDERTRTAELIRPILSKHSVNHVFSSPTSIINFTSKKPSYDDTRRSGRDNELLQRAQNDL